MNLYICAGSAGARPSLLSFLDDLEPKLRGKVIVGFAMLACTPLGLLGEPHVKHFSLERYREFYEFRAKSKDMVRIIFTQIPEGKLLLVYPFVKKQSRDTGRALEAAVKIMEEVRTGRCATMELPIHELEAGP